MKLFANPFKQGINFTQFVVGLILLLLLPILTKVNTYLKGEIITVTSKGVYSNQYDEDKNIYSLSGYTRYVHWEGNLSNGATISIKTRVKYSNGKYGAKEVAVIDVENIENSFILSFPGIYLNFNSVIILTLVKLWIIAFFVYGQSEKTSLRIRKISKWYLKLGAYLSVVLLFLFVFILPVYLFIEKGWAGLLIFLFFTLLIFSQLKETFKYLFYTEEKLKAMALAKIEKKKQDTINLNKEIIRRRNLKK